MGKSDDKQKTFEMNYWLLKTEPATYSWLDLEKERRACWDGVRNFQARNYLRAMAVNDLALFYHSGNAKEVVGVVSISKAAFPDPSDTAWTAVEIRIHTALKRPISLMEIKASPPLMDMVLVKSSRLSVQPVQPSAFQFILSMSERASS